MKNVGLYLHIPFCKSKCPYCDFYSMRADEETKSRYVTALSNRIATEISEKECKADTLYIGGGTPSVLGAENLSKIVNSARPFLTENAEITVECNPFSLNDDFFKILSANGVNRISMGLQSANDNERRILGRLSNRETVKNAVLSAQHSGIENISLDIMLGVPKQTSASLHETLKFVLSLGVPHISSYILKLEEGTLFYKKQNELDLPSDDETADMYLQVKDELEKGEIYQYEISNYSKKGFESRHNLKYWNCEEYLGLGPSAHSFLDGKRFYFDRDLDAFLSGEPPIPDGTGGDFTEFAMLGLRLCEGISNKKVNEKFGFNIPNEIIEKSQIFIKNGLMNFDDETLKLTPNGFLLSNTILAEIL